MDALTFLLFLQVAVTWAYLTNKIPSWQASHVPRLVQTDYLLQQSPHLKFHIL